MTQLIDYSQINSLAEIWSIVAEKCSNITALHDPHSKPELILTYGQLKQQIEQFAASLQALGVESGDKIALFADNSPRWFIADQGIMRAGLTNAVRSSQADTDELLYIYEDSDSVALVVEDLKTLNKLRPQLDQLTVKFVVLLCDQEPSSNEVLKILNFSQFMQQGLNHSLTPITQTKDSLATLIYTSGTTGKPKGVMLSHSNLLHQVNNLGIIVQPQPGDRVLSILPSWHSYERTVEYFLLSQGCTQIYTNLRTFKNDLKRFKPHYMVGVPRLWESIYEGIQKQFQSQSPNQQKLVNFFLKISQKYVNAYRIANNLSLNHLHASGTERLIAKIQATLLAPIHQLGDRLIYQKVRQGIGGSLKAWISGGGSLAPHIDNFYEIINIPLLVGYGLTETSPVTNARTLKRNLKGSAGRPVPGTEIRIVDPNTRQNVAKGEKGLVLIRGPQVMQGYYKKPEATAKAIDGQGWFDSGDLGWVTPMNDLVLTGRAKDTIVLNNGENIEPQPIEDACIRSPYIDQIMLVGQDQKSLGALIVPNLEALEKWIQSQQLNVKLPDVHASRQEILHSPLYEKTIQTLFRQELKRQVQDRPGYRADDQIKVFEFILEPFSLDNGMMTQTLKIKRPVVAEQYRAIIDGMYN
jgi:long-chain acyl-CoA synthetase